MKSQWKLGFLIVFLVLGFILCSQQLPPRCGKWRWDVKTITDKDGAALLSRPPTQSSIDVLVGEKPSKVLYSLPDISPVAGEQ